MNIEPHESSSIVLAFAGRKKDGAGALKGVSLQLLSTGDDT
jgi:hypothetical protein